MTLRGVEDVPVHVAGQTRNHLQARILPDAYLVLRMRGGVAVCRDQLVRGQGPDEIANLSAHSARCHGQE